MRRIWRLRPSTSVISYQGFAASLTMRTPAEPVFTRLPSSVAIENPTRSFAMASSFGVPATLTKYVLGTCEAAFVGQDQQALAGVITPPSRVSAALHPANKVHHRRTLLRIAHRSHESL